METLVWASALLCACLHLSAGCGVGPGFKNFGGSFSHSDMGDGRTGNYIEETDQLTCDFSGSWACQWGSDGPGNHKWQKASGQVEPAKWDRMFGTPTQPNGEYAIIDLGNGEEPDYLRSDPMYCMKGDGYLSFKYWTTRKFGQVQESSVKVCALKEGTKTPIWCSQEFNKDSKPASPGPVDLNVPGDINEPFELAFIPSGKGYVAIDEVFFDANDVQCLTTTTSTTTTTTTTTTPKPTTTTTKATAAPTAAPTTTPPAVVVCEKTTCNFDSQDSCSYVDLNAQSGAGSGAQQKFNYYSGRLGNPDTGVKYPADGSRYYAGTEINKGERAVLEASGFKSAGPRQLKFKYWEATDQVWVKVCFNSLTNCPWNSNRGVKVNERGWLEANVPMPEGTDKVYFVAENLGNNFSAVGIDEISMVVTDSSGNARPAC